MKRGEMLKSEVAPGFKSLCRDSQPITSMLFGDELPQSIRELFGDELPQTSSRAALPESRPPEKRSKSGLAIGKSCEVYPKVGGRLRLFSLFWEKFFRLINR